MYVPCNHQGMLLLKKYCLSGIQIQLGILYFYLIIQLMCQLKCQSSENFNWGPWIHF